LFVNLCSKARWKRPWTSSSEAFIRFATIYFEVLGVCFHYKDEGSTIEGRVNEGRRNNASNSVWFFPSPFLYFSIMCNFLCVSIFYFIYFQHVCGSSSFYFPSPWINFTIILW
jgi:hypothetical protein